ncbi:MAG: large conductance mechanosensitive channel protein MscL, partial [Saprospiraceae bacterium]|nr:large conductance mechanosensitive channel protein MscL [Saprospiraceae bacterium]
EMLKEFKEFAMKGNMLDMAVGIVIGAAFGTVIKSLVDDILMPLLASIFGTPDFSNLFVVLKAPADAAGVDMTSIAAVREAGGVALGWGLFINALIAFILVALALWVVVRNMNRLKKKEEEAPAPDPGPTAEELLTEIRDALKAGR